MIVNGGQVQSYISVHTGFKEHSEKENHAIDWENVKVVDKDQQTIPRKIKEAIQIKRLKPSMNRDVGLDLPPVYDHLLSSDPVPLTRSGDVTSAFKTTLDKATVMAAKRHGEFNKKIFPAS